VIACGVLGFTLLVAPFAAEGGSAVGTADFVVIKHLEGSLAVGLEHVESVFQFERKEGQPARVRLNLPAGDSKTVEGAEAEALWSALRDKHAAAFVWVGHMQGTLGIPVHKIQSAYRAANGDVRLNYPGDPQGKTLKGDEAAQVWSRLTAAR
jgi:hypothetical protein